MEIRGKIDKLERPIWKTQGVDSYILELEGLFDGVNETLLDKFKMQKIDKFDGIGNPKSHMCMCVRAFSQRV